MTTSRPTGKTAEKDDTIKYSDQESHLLQQQAIEKILSWILKRAQKDNTIDKAQNQFEDICMSMNKFGIKPANAGQLYCESRLALDNFMAEPVLRLTNRSGDDMRADYLAHVQVLGAKKMDNAKDPNILVELTCRLGQPNL